MQERQHAAPNKITLTTEVPNDHYAPARIQLLFYSKQIEEK